MSNCENLIRPALESFTESFEIRSADPGCKVVTPFQHPDGDLVTVWVENRGGAMYTIRDYGKTFAMLQLHGVDPETESRKRRLEFIHSQYRLESTSGELLLAAKGDQLGDRIIDAVQAIVAVSHLIYTHQQKSLSRFKNEVEEYLREVGYDFESNFSVAGTNLQRKFDFGINHREPMVLLDTIHGSDPYELLRKAEPILLSWYEIQDLDFQHGVVVDDENGEFDETSLAGLEKNLDYFFRWTSKKRIEEEIPVSP